MVTTIRTLRNIQFFDINVTHSTWVERIALMSVGYFLSYQSVHRNISRGSYTL